jgi:hypothetical protein
MKGVDRLCRQVTWEADQLQKRMEATAAGALEGPANPNRESMNDELLRVLRQELSEARAKLVVSTNNPICKTM